MIIEKKTDAPLDTLLDCVSMFDENERVCLSDEAIPGEISRIMNDAAYLAEIANGLIPSSTVIGVDTIRRIWVFAHRIVKRANHVDFFESLLKAILLQKPDEERRCLLNALVEEESPYFWSYALLLKDVLPIIPLSATFLSEWLPRLAEKEGDDMAGGNAFAIAFTYSKQNPDVGLSVVERYIGDDFERTKSIIVQEALGGLRVSTGLTNELRVRLEKVEKTLSENLLVEWRVCFYRSWGATLINQAFDPDALLAKVSLMMAGTPEEMTAAFYVVRRLMLHFIHTESADATSSVFIEWLLENSKAVLPDYAKHEVAVSLAKYTLQADEEVMPEDTALKLMQIATLIQPIPLENKGTWRYLLEFSAQIAKRTLPEQWVDFWTHLMAADPKNVLIENLDHNSDARFWYYLEEAKLCEIVTRLLFHKDELARRYGHAFLVKVKPFALDGASLASISDKRFLLGLLDLTQKLHNEAQLLPFVVGVAPRLALVDDTQIQKRCLFAIRLLIINYPDTLIKAVKDVCLQYPVLEEPVQAAEKYFSEIQTWRKSPVNSFFRHELFDVAFTYRRSFDSQVHEAVRKGSLMTILCGEPTGIIYGDGFEIVQDGKISDKTPFQRFSSSFEIPRLPMFDPEGDRIRRMRMREEIKELEHDES